jgi:hypothetical protein
MRRELDRPVGGHDVHVRPFVVGHRDRRLTNTQLTELLSHLPSTIVRYLRNAGLARG